MATIKISDEELSSINRALQQRHGIDFTQYETSSLKRRVSRIIEKHSLGSVISLWRKILSDPAFVLAYVDDITVGLTEMFRNPEFWIKLEKEVLPTHALGGPMKFWHAGCSTGEEVYSMSIVLDQNGWLDDTKLVATDLNSNSVIQSRRGRFDKDLFLKYNKNFQEYKPGKTLNDYFDLGSNFIQAKPELQKHMEFSQHNLTKDPYPRGFQLIFCRNVMIYFDEDLKRKILKQFHDSLTEGGHLIIGYYDAMPHGSDQMWESSAPGEKIFRKK